MKQITMHFSISFWGKRTVPWMGWCAGGGRSYKTERRPEEKTFAIYTPDDATFKNRINYSPNFQMDAKNKQFH